MRKETEAISKEDFMPVPYDPGAGEKKSRPSMSFWQESLVYLKKDPVTLICIGILALMVFGAIIFPMLSPFGYETQNVAFSNKGLFQKDPLNGGMHWFGTDHLGRDIFVRMWYGARVSLTVAVSVALIDCFIGVIYGGISGYAGGMTDNCMMRILEVISGIPYLLVVLLLMAVLPRGMITLIIAYSITGWTGMARLVRGQVLGLKEQEFMIAAKIMGLGAGRIIRRHIVPNLIGLIIVNVTLDIPAVIFTEAFLSLLGLGIAPPFPSWGIMASSGIAVFQSYPFQLVIPSVFICLTMLAFNLLGDRLQSALDPKMRRLLPLGRRTENRKSKNIL